MMNLNKTQATIMLCSQLILAMTKTVFTSPSKLKLQQGQSDLSESFILYENIKQEGNSFVKSNFQFMPRLSV